MNFYPILLNLKGKNALVIGAGRVSLRKIRALLDAGAEVAVISREIVPEIKQMIDAGKVRLSGSEYSPESLKNIFIVVAATDDAELNKRVFSDADTRGILVNCVDSPAECNFILPAVGRKGDLILAVSTSGAVPGYARKLRDDLCGVLDAGERKLKLLKRMRDKIKGKLSSEERKAIIDKIVEMSAEELNDFIEKESWEI